MTPQTTRIVTVIGAFLAGLLVISGALLLVVGRTPVQIATPSAIGGPFKLVDQNGQAVTEEVLKGKPSLIFFGFTHCPDVCPTALFDMSELYKALGRDGDKVGAYFVTVDPERDTPAVMKEYLSSFDPRLRGLTGDPAAVAAMEKAYRVYSKKVPLDGGGYTMDHTALVYLMNKDGQFIAPFNLKRKPEEAATDLKRYL
ncbi:SCO family protein [Pseudorhodoplanes sinuspersici]|uniref:Copper-binding protein n=1 Tax=Pseudorhodoplanes sinuspersici TaxID=1235591 RepID=A0A1W6ZML3_9HYPH|nr:SCO family protein [Pseudorhodoplanes sinuspersici]ARP98626.1 copper-binding protein [Pseudorhodoplanes sinuspersici]RKE69789.1 protein SCO1/2 [Pseudorhodoplanes sinuspersici]